MHNFFLTTAFLLFSVSSVQANCLAFTENERLSNYCLLNEVDGKIIDEHTAAIIFKRLKNEGYFGGIKEPIWSTNIKPSVSYSHNINGGNSNKKLIIGNLEFEGDPELVAKRGMIATLNLNANYRSTISEGRYITAGLVGSVSYSPEHQLSSGHLAASICSQNKIRNDVHFDLCGSSSHQRKKLSIDRVSNIEASMSRQFNKKHVGYFEGKLSLVQAVTDNYTQNQIRASLDLIHKNDWFGSVTFGLGERVQNNLVLDYSFNAIFSKYIFQKKFTFEISNEYYKGSKFLGMQRDDISKNISVYYDLAQNVGLSFGYHMNNSSIAYYDQEYPSLTLTQRW